MKLENVLVVGGSGFVGRHLVAALVRHGIDVTVPTRAVERAKHLTLLPTVQLVEADVFAPGVLERLAQGKQMVDNLTGILHSRRGRRDERGPNDYGPDFARVHVELPQAIVRACRAAGVRRLPVVDERNAVVGLLSFDDLIRHYQGNFGAFAALLTPGGRAERGPGVA